MSAVYYTKESLSKKGGSYRLIYGLSRLEFGLPLREMTSKEAQEGGHIKIFRLIAKLTISCGVNILWYTGRAKLEANYHRVHIVCFEMYIFESSYGFLVYFKVVPVVPLSPGNFKCLFTFLPDVRRNDILIKGRCYLVGLVVSIFFADHEVLGLDSQVGPVNFVLGFSSEGWKSVVFHPRTLERRYEGEAVRPVLDLSQVLSKLS